MRAVFKLNMGSVSSETVDQAPFVLLQFASGAKRHHLLARGAGEHYTLPCLAQRCGTTERWQKAQRTQNSKANDGSHLRHHEITPHRVNTAPTVIKTMTGPGRGLQIYSHSKGIEPR